MVRNIGLPIRKMVIRCVTYGCGTSFDQEKFQAIAPYPGRNWINKPEGGLWGSPVNSKHSWRDFCKDAAWRKCNEEDSFQWDLIGKVFVVDSYSDCQQLPWIGHDPLLKSGLSLGIDWEKLKARCSALYLTEQGEHDTRYRFDYTMYGYDCECVLAFDDTVIFPV